jgi:hypothetical protein
MTALFQMLGELPPAEIALKLREIGDDEAAEFYELQATKEDSFLAESLFSPRIWLYTQPQIGFIPPFKPGTKRFHTIISATNMLPDNSLANQRINIRLDWLRAYSYPLPFIDLGNNVHTILFTFEARNQVKDGDETIAFNQTYYAHSGQDVAVAGNPIFIGLTVSPNGIGFSGETVNVGNSSDEKLVRAMTSQATKTGLNLLKTAQPALVPFVGLAQELGALLGKRRMNTSVQKFWLGLDFDKGAPGARLAIGSYIVAQVRHANDITWSDWSYDTETGTVVRTNLAKGQEPCILPYNAVAFRVSLYRE